MSNWYQIQWFMGSPDFRSTARMSWLGKTAKSFLFFSFLVLFGLTTQGRSAGHSFYHHHPLGQDNPPGVILYPTPLTNIVITSLYFISHCPLGQHICAFMHWGHDYHSMFPLYLLFAEAERGYHLGTKLIAKGNPLSKRILWTLCYWTTPIWKSFL